MRVQRLRLSRETLRALQMADLRKVGGEATNTNCNTCYISCHGFGCNTIEFQTCGC